MSRRNAPPSSRTSTHLLALTGEIVLSGLAELWHHKLRSVLTLILLMLGVFALVILTSVLDGVIDKIGTGFAGMSWDGTLVLVQKSPETTEERGRFAMSPGLRMEDIPRLTSPHEKVLAFVPRAFKQVDVRVTAGTEPVFVMGVTPEYFPAMGRKISLGRGLTEDDQQRRSPVAVLGASMAGRLLGGVDPVGKQLVLDGVPFHIIGVLAPLMIFSEDAYMDANGILVPLEAYGDRLEPTHRLDQLGVKLVNTRDLKEVTAMMLARAQQAHHGIKDVEVVDLDADKARSYRGFMTQMRGWRIVIACLAGIVLVVGGVGVLSVMLISCSERRYEIGLRKAVGATDQEIFAQFLLESLVLAALGALAGTLSGVAVCRIFSDQFPFGLMVNPFGLATAWFAALALATAFGLYPAIKAMRLSPMEAMR